MGEELSTLDQGDLVTVATAMRRYRGDVVGIDRQQCDFVEGVIEDGYISVQLHIDSESVNRYELATEYLLVSATEETPRS